MPNNYTNEFENVLFGSLDDSEPDTAIEDDILRKVLLFFSGKQTEIEYHLPEIRKSLELLKEHKENYDGLMCKEEYIYRYTSSYLFEKKYNIEYDYKMTLDDIESDADEIRLGKVTNYGIANMMSSWTTEPYDEYMSNSFGLDGTILLKTKVTDDVVFNSDFTEAMKKYAFDQGRLAKNFVGEAEVILVNNKKPIEDCYIVVERDGIISLDFLDIFIDELNYRTRYDDGENWTEIIAPDENDDGEHDSDNVKEMRYHYTSILGDFIKQCLRKT